MCLMNLVIYAHINGIKLNITKDYYIICIAECKITKKVANETVYMQIYGFQ